MIQRADVNELLVKNGDYLLRKTNAGESRLALSVKWADQIRHFVVLEQEKDVFFEEQGHHEPEVDALVKWHERKKKPITQQSGAIIKRAIAREEWVLTHESVTLGEQIGAGQFGEVCAAFCLLFGFWTFLRFSKPSSRLHRALRLMWPSKHFGMAKL